MRHRSAELTAFLNSLHRAIAERVQAKSDALQVTEKIMLALRVEQPPASQKPVWLPVCSLLDDAVENVEENPEHSNPFDANLVEHAQALEALSPQLAWWHRPDARQWGEPFASGHANATIIGQGGLEERDDVCGYQPGGP